MGKSIEHKKDKFSPTATTVRRSQRPIGLYARYLQMREDNTPLLQRRRRMISAEKNRIYPKLEVVDSEDASEREADATVDQVISSPESDTDEEKVQTKPLATSISRKGQTQGSGVPVTSNTAAYVSGLSGGQPLSRQEKNFYEPRFGSDFSNVRVHNDSKAHEAAQSINAKAFTSGNNIVFGKDQYSPDSSSGKHLMAHELTHTVQQGGGTNKLQRQATNNLGQPQNETFSIDPDGILPFYSPKEVTMQNLGEIEITYGYFSWNRAQPTSPYQSNPYRLSRTEKVLEKLMVGSQAAWATVLEDADNSETVRRYIKLFVLAAAGEGYYFTRQPETGHLRDQRPVRSRNSSVYNETIVKNTYVTKNTISRQPVISETNILNFLKALYSVGVKSNLDLTRSHEEYNTEFHNSLAKLISTHQHSLLEDIVTNRSNSGHALISHAGVEGLVGEVRPEVKLAIISSGNATAIQGVKKFSDARMLTNATAKEDQETLGSRLIQNAGVVLSASLSRIDQETANEAIIAEIIIKTVSDLIPYSGAAKALKQPVIYLARGLARLLTQRPDRNRYIEEYINFVHNVKDEGLLTAREEALLVALFRSFI